ncbi:MAG: Mth938-like domain-containing protein [bacterium]
MEIQSYSFGKIQVDGKVYSRDLILYPERVQENWRRKEGHLLQVDDLSGLEPAGCDRLVIGTGAQGVMEVAGETRRWLDRMRMKWEAMPTAEACRRYNALARQGGRVAAALHLTC